MKEQPEEYDYVIAGGGSAGSVLAARLSEDPSVSVCLIEAGGEGRGILVRAPMAMVAMLPGYGRINNWAFMSAPQPALDGRRCYQPRGRGLGGSSAINAMLYTRGHPSDYDDWSAAGCTGWGWDDVLPYFRKSERNQRGGNDLHGDAGPLPVSEQRTPRAISRAFIDACAEMQVPRNDDFNGPQQEGAGLFQVTQFNESGREGERCSAAAAYLHPVMDRPNLEVITGAQATRIRFAGRRATGVDIRRGRVTETVSARREVLVSAGAFGSPHLLMLSGIGPGAHLQANGIDVVNDLEGVGANLQDHLDFVLAYRTDDREVLGLHPAGAWMLMREAFRWRRDGTGILASPGAEAGAFVKSDPALDRPDLQLHFVAAIVDDHARKLHWGFGYSAHVCVLRPRSRGTVTLAGPDARTPPVIDPRYLSDERDARSLLDGVKLTRRIMQAPALAPYRRGEIYLEGVGDDETLMRHIRQRAGTIYHPCGTCRMGTDDGAVLDPQLRVRGMDGLRVIDASVMPTIIGGNTNAPVIMIAEKAAAMIAKG